MKTYKEQESRNDLIYKAHLRGLTFKAIAVEFGLSAIRISQIVHKRERITKKRNKWDDFVSRYSVKSQ